MAKNVKDLSVHEQIIWLKEQRDFSIENNHQSIADAYEKKIQQLMGIENSIGVEKKNNNANSVNVEQSAIAQNASVQPQSSTTKPDGKGVESNVAVYTDNRSIDALLSKKFIGLIHEGKFNTTDGYKAFMKVKNRLRTLIVNWLRMKVKRGEDLKKNAMIDLVKELNRLVRNEVRQQYKDDILSIKFFVSDGKEKVYYGCDETLINDIFK